MDGMVSLDLAKGHAAENGLHCDTGLELRAMGSALGHRWGTLGRGGAPLQTITIALV